MSEATQEQTKPSDNDKRAGKTKVKLKPEEREAQGEELARKVNERNELDAKKSTHVKEWNEQPRQLDDDIAELAEEVDTGWAYRSVQLVNKTLAGEAPAKSNGKANGSAKPKKAKKAK